MMPRACVQGPSPPPQSPPPPPTTTTSFITSTKTRSLLQNQLQLEKQQRQAPMPRENHSQSADMSPLHMASSAPLLSSSVTSSRWMGISQDQDSRNRPHYQSERQGHEQQQQPQQQVHWEHRSFPHPELAQQPLSKSRSNPIAIVSRPPKDPEKLQLTHYDDDSDDEGIIDVERDALKLKQKYGPKVVSVSFKGDSEIPEKLLRAPYLGSMGSSEDYLLRGMPPMTLSSDFSLASNEEIRGYGSLRDSHQKGRFLDGPSSYRDGRSGQIHRLGNRIRFNSGTPSLSIGERMQQTRKLKELNKKKEEENGSKNKEEVTSSLSAMMNQVTQLHPNKSIAESKAPDVEGRIADSEMTGSLDNMADGPNHDSFMMSTSFTVFEVMTGTKLTEPPSSICGQGVEDNCFSHSHGSLAIYPPIDLTGERQFQALSRSMSDPTPHLHGPSKMHHSNSQSSLKTQSTSTATATTTSTWNPVPMDIKPECVTASPMDTLESDHDNIPQPPGSIPPMYNLSSIDHNPDTDGAFDMDLE